MREGIARAAAFAKVDVATSPSASRSVQWPNEMELARHGSTNGTVVQANHMARRSCRQPTSRSRECSRVTKRFRADGLPISRRGSEYLAGRWRWRSAERRGVTWRTPVRSDCFGSVTIRQRERARRALGARRVGMRNTTRCSMVARAATSFIRSTIVSSRARETWRRLARA